MAAVSPISRIDIFCPPPLGKPGPNGSRVKQKAQEGETCFLYALNRLRKWYKYEEGPAYAEKREKEKAVSEFRKKLTEWSIKREITISIIENMNEPSNEGVEEEESAIQLNNEKVAEGEPAIPPPGFSPEIERFLQPERLERFFTTLMEKFEEQQELELPDFLYDLFNKGRQKIHEELIEQLQIADKVEILFQQVASPRQQENQALSNVIRHNIVYQLIATDLYQLNLSTWNPSHPIKNFAETLAHGGAHLCILEKEYRANPPIKIGSIADRSVYGWQEYPGTPDDVHHVVIAVGAHIEEGWVYYIDPLDPSDPADCDSQKIYRISYEEWCSSSCNIYGDKRGSFPYAYYVDKRTAPLKAPSPAVEEKE